MGAFVPACVKKFGRRKPADAGRTGYSRSRAVWVETTLAGAGRLTGDLTPAGTAAVNTVLDSLAAKAGPEDTRSLTQRRHDALEEACPRLITVRRHCAPGKHLT